MALAETMKYDQLTLEVETDTPGTYAKVCGMKDFTVDGNLAMDEDEVPDCADESLPNSVVVSPRSVTVAVSGTGVWAKTSHDMMHKWNRLAQRKNVRITYGLAAVGDVYTETGPAYLTKLSAGRTKGKVVTAEIEIRFDGVPTAADRAS